LSKRNVKLILKILGDLEPLRGSSNKKTYSCVNWVFFGVEELIVNAPLCRVNNAKSEVGFKQLICNPWCVHNQLFNAYFEEKFKGTPDITKSKKPEIDLCCAT
jgi:hypothetical protein